MVDGDTQFILPKTPSDPGDWQPALLIGARVGRFQIESFKGRGGFGEVYTAVEVSGLRRQVALKLVHAQKSGDALAAAFVEAAAIERCAHPSIPAYIDSGAMPDGNAYIAMEFVAGDSLEEWCVKMSRPLFERVALILQIVDAVAAAHRVGVIHRDIKPSNVLVNSTISPAHAVLVDFGVAALTASASIVGVHQDSTTGEFATSHSAISLPVGTIEAMPPEQLSTGALPDTRSDVYALGVLLYVTLTGVPPFRRSSDTPEGAKALIERIRADSPPSLATILYALPRALRNLRIMDLNAIVSKALAKSPEDRYQTANDFREDLDRVLQGDTPRVALRTTLAHALRMMRRNRIAAIATAVALLALFFSVGFSLWSASVERDARRVAEASLDAQERNVETFREVLTALLKDLRSLGNAPEFLAHSPKLLDAFRALYGPEHPRVRSQELFYSELLIKAERYGEALAILRTLEGLSLAAGGPTHPSTLMIQRSIALCQQGLNDRDAAIATLDTIIAAFDKGVDPCDTRFHPWGIVALLGQLRSEGGEHERALELLARAIEMQRNCFGREGPAMLNDVQAMSLYADALSKATRVTEAVAIYEEVIARESETQGASPTALRAWFSRARMFRAMCQLKIEPQRLHDAAVMDALRNDAVEWKSLTNPPASAYAELNAILESAGLQPLSSTPK